MVRDYFRMVKLLLRGYIRLVNRTTSVGLNLSIGLIIVTTILIVVDICIRALSGYALMFTVEYSEYLANRQVIQPVRYPHLGREPAPVIERAELHAGGMTGGPLPGRLV